MANRENYTLNIHKSGNSICVSNTSTGERIITITKGHEYSNSKIPYFILKECFNILHANTFELNRGYILNGESCQINDRRL